MNSSGYTQMQSATICQINMGMCELLHICKVYQNTKLLAFNCFHLTKHKIHVVQYSTSSFIPLLQRTPGIVEFTLDLEIVTSVRVSVMSLLLGNLYKSISDEMVACGKNEESNY